MTALRQVIDQLKREIAEDRGEIPTTGRPACPLCRTPLEAKYGRHAKRFSIIHSKHPCDYRFSTFAIGQTEEEAWEKLPKHEPN